MTDAKEQGDDPALEPQKQQQQTEDVYLRHLSVEQTFVRVWKVFGTQWKVFLSVAAAAVLLQYALSILMAIVYKKFGFMEEDQQQSYSAAAQQPQQSMLWNHARRFLEDAAAADDDAAAADDAVNNGQDDYYENVVDEYEYDQGQYTSSNPWVLLGSLLHDLMYYLVVAISDGALIRAVTEVYTQQTPAIMGSFRAGVSRALTLMASSLLVSLMCVIPLMLLAMVFMVPSTSAFFFGMLLIVCFVVFVTIVTYHMYPAIMVEQCGAWGGIQRSWSLSEGHRFYIFIILLLFGLAKFIIQMFIAAAALGTTGNWAGRIFSILLYLTYLTISAAWGAILQAVVYFSVRVAKEGLTVEQLAEQSGISLETPYATLNEKKESSQQKDEALSSAPLV